MKRKGSPREFFVLTPYDPLEGTSLSHAARRCGRAVSTVKNWCNEFGIGRRVAGTWVVSKPALEMFLDGDQSALLAYHGRQWENPTIKPYFDRLGIPYCKAQK